MLIVSLFVLVIGHRYCIDGGALIFVPNDQKGADGDLEFVRGDLPPAKAVRPVFQG
jgi:hypothetical protein